MKLLLYILAIPNTLRLNIKCFGIREGMKLPIFCSHKVKIKNIYRGYIVIDGDYKTGMIRLGMGEGSFMGAGERRSIINIAQSAQLIFKGAANLSNNFTINLNSGAEVRIGKDFYSNYNFLLSSSSQIFFGDDCLIGWNVQIIDSDGHKSGTQFSELKEVPRPIKIGNHVWICSGASILKGTFLKEGCIVALNATISSKIEQDHVLVAGIPAKVIKRNIDWDH